MLEEEFTTSGNFALHSAAYPMAGSETISEVVVAVGWVEVRNPTNRILPNQALQLTAAAFGSSSVNGQPTVFGLADAFGPTFLKPHFPGGEFHAEDVLKRNRKLFERAESLLDDRQPNPAESENGVQAGN